jgi:hypothetical protein
MIPNLQPQNANAINVLQEVEVVTEDGFVFMLKLWYFDQQQNWFYSISYIKEDGTTFVLNNLRLTVGDTLANYRQTIPFGLWCISNDGGDPSFDTDFTPVNPADQFSARIQLYTLSKAEIAIINNDLSWLGETKKYLRVLS